MPELRTFVVTAADAGTRLDQCLRARAPELSRRELLTLFRSGHIRLNGRLAAKGVVVQFGDQIEVDGMPARPGPAADAEVSLRIIYEDAHLVVVDKPAGMPSHALRAEERGTVVSGLLSRYPELRGVGYRERESGLLHRLDNDTSGVLLAVRDQATFERLRAAHEHGELEKRYLALVPGRPSTGRIDAFLRADRRRVRVSAAPFEGAKPITTELQPCSSYEGYTLVRVQVALAGRHQVRAQLAALGHPIAGDALYEGPSLPGLHRHFLHASELSVPYQGRRLVLSAPLPSDLQSVLDSLS